MISFFLLLWPCLAIKPINKVIIKNWIVIWVKGRKVKKAIICVITSDTAITYIGHNGEVGFLPEKYLKIK